MREKTERPTNSELWFIQFPASLYQALLTTLQNELCEVYEGREVCEIGERQSLNFFYSITPGPKFKRSQAVPQELFSTAFTTFGLPTDT
jgi:hypothetical protein